MTRQSSYSLNSDAFARLFQVFRCERKKKKCAESSSPNLRTHLRTGTKSLYILQGKLFKTCLPTLPSMSKNDN
eukprot:scaffold128020_cov47-Attheya_sp.AAC.4